MLVPNSSYTYKGFQGKDNIDNIQGLTGENTITTKKNTEKVDAINVGKYDAELTTTLNSNDYNFINGSNGTLEITPRTVYVQAGTGSKTYDGKAVSGSIVGYKTLEYDSTNNTGFVKKEDTYDTQGDKNSLKYTLDDADTATDVKRDGKGNVISYVVGLNGIDKSKDGNYEFKYLNGYYTINPAKVTVQAGTGSKTYDGTAVSGNAAGYTATGFVNAGETYNGLVGDGYLHWTIGSTDKVSTVKRDTNGNVISYEVGLTSDVTSKGNYTYEYLDGSYTINPREVIIQAGSGQKTYDGQATLAENLGTLVGYKVEEPNADNNTGFVGEDDYEKEGNVQTLQWALDNAASATNVKRKNNVSTGDVDSYEVELTGIGSKGNYKYTYKNGAYTINPRQVVIQAGSGEKTYDGVAVSADTLGYTTEAATDTTGFINGDTYQQQDNENTLQWALDNAASATNVKRDKDHKVISYEVGLKGTDSKGNYSYSYKNGAYTINPFKAVIQANDFSRREDGTAYVAGTHGYHWVQGLLGSDTASSLGLTTGQLSYAIIADATDGADGAVLQGRYNIYLDGSWSADNYDFEYRPGQLILTAPAPTAAEQHTMDNIQSITGRTDGLDRQDISQPGSINRLMPEPMIPELPGSGMVSMDGGATAARLTAGEDAVGFVYEYGHDRHHAPNYGRTPYAIPFLITDYEHMNTDEEQSLQGFYNISYNNDKLVVEPGDKGLVPNRSEIEPELDAEFETTYSDEELGIFQVKLGNGIVSIHPVDAKALDTVPLTRRCQSVP